jgi:type IV secretory pathway VirB10-like protein
MTEDSTPETTDRAPTTIAAIAGEAARRRDASEQRAMSYDRIAAALENLKNDDLELLREITNLVIAAPGFTLITVDGFPVGVEPTDQADRPAGQNGDRSDISEPPAAPDGPPPTAPPAPADFDDDEEPPAADSDPAEPEPGPLAQGTGLLDRQLERSKAEREGGPPPQAPKSKRGRERVGAAEQKAEEALAYIRSHPGCTASEMAGDLGWPQPTASQIVIRLAKGGGASSPAKIRRQPGPRNSKLLYAADAPMGTEDGDGAKTETERKVVEVLRAAPTGLALTANEILANSGLPRHTDIGSIAGALQRRGVLQRDTAGTKPRWRLA